MLRKENNDYVGLHSTLPDDNVASSNVADIPKQFDLQSAGVSRTTLSGTRGGIQKIRGLPKTYKNSESNVNEEDEPLSEQKKEKPGCSQASKVICKKSDFSEPKLLTSLKIIESLHNLEETCQAKLQKGDSNVTKKASRKLNVPFEEKIYKDLIDLHVNDDALGLSSLPVKPKEILRAKDPEPVLSDFYKPKFNKEYVVKPPLPSFEMSKFSMPQLPSVYEISKRWEPENIS